MSTVHEARSIWESAWEAQIARLIESPDMRERLGAAGRRTVEQRYSLTALAPRLAELLKG